MDLSNGYESISAEWLTRRGRLETRAKAIGAREVRDWVKTLPRGSSVIDLGCGPGTPLTILLVEAGLEVFGVDASPSFVAAFRRNLPSTHVLCESVLESNFFEQTFDAALCVGLMFLLREEEQHRLIDRFAEVLKPGGRLLFTSTVDPHVWNDAMTGQRSVSHGAEEYRRRLSAVGVTVVSEFEDAGENHYFDAIKAV